jgi:hypothetical protein
MKKRGLDYQELVATIVRALDSQASVKSGQWCVGPDGQRDIDVEIRGIHNGREYFILVECKDYTYGSTRRRVSINEIDALESKRRDLKADLTVLCSNTGFSAPALRKAGRVGIVTISALATNDNRASFIIEHNFVATGLSVEKWSVMIYCSEEDAARLPVTWGPNDVFYLGSPITNWLNKHSQEILLAHPGKQTIRETLVFKELLPVTIKGEEILLRGITLTMFCSIAWFQQKVKENLTLGFFDHLTRQFILPPGQSWIFGPIDKLGWKRLKRCPKDIQKSNVELSMTLLNPIKSIEGFDMPLLDEFILESKVDLLSRNSKLRPEMHSKTVN